MNLLVKSNRKFKDSDRQSPSSGRIWPEKIWTFSEEGQLFEMLGFSLPSAASLYKFHWILQALVMQTNTSLSTFDDVCVCVHVCVHFINTWCFNAIDCNISFLSFKGPCLDGSLFYKDFLPLYSLSRILGSVGILFCRQVSLPLLFHLYKSCLSVARCWNISTLTIKFNLHQGHVFN